ncbi:MAG TPA: LLM class flavin-dependent oxidoreductase [Acidimicrobiales bacterium]|jgi:alkanesulfonate monooxygenase SsuD/methylene tetrahydromethanopterin reductase-like flavin-dependent oxidoreductase (luciferase family)|nr:LLM class flavin-dependent oxidoreductase [Acidimicrobiales bacterium]
MKFGVFYELQLARPWAEDSELRLYNDALDQIELADRLGYDYAWAVEHHFLEEYSHCSAPEVFLGAASQRTRNIRLGHGIMQLTTNHPAKAVERISALDLVSNGRVEFGMGESASVTELHPFGVRFRDKREIWEDAVRCAIPMFGTGGVEYHGPHFDFPLRNVLPKPHQKPHPPLWTACSQIETIAYAGHRGLGALGFQFVSADAATAWVHAYYNAMTRDLDRLADYPVNPNIALVSMFMCADTDEEARAQADGATFFQFCLRYYNTPDRKRPDPGEVNMWDEYTAWKQANPDAAERALSGGLIGSPDTIRRKLRKFAASNIDQVILLNQAGRNSHTDICASLELFAHEVMDEFHADIPAHDEWKAAVMAGDIALDEIDTSPYLRRFGAKSVKLNAGS